MGDNRAGSNPPVETIRRPRYSVNESEPCARRGDSWTHSPGQYGKNCISFCAVNSGPVRTERWAGHARAMSCDWNISLEEADFVTCLASDRAHFVNGTTIEIDGGQRKPLMDMSRDRR